MTRGGLGGARPIVRTLGAPPLIRPAEIERLLVREDKRIVKLARERNRIDRALVRARARKSALMRLGNDLARAALDGAL